MGCVSSKKKLSKADLDFLQENTEFTKEQIIEWYEGFIVSLKLFLLHHIIIRFISEIKLLFLEVLRMSAG
jgi:hypothetical protein